MIKPILAIATLAVALSGNAFAEQQYDKPGFFTIIEDGRLWVFKDPSPALADEQKNGLPEKAVIRIGGGPGGITIKSNDDDTIQAYLDPSYTGIPAAPAASH